MCKRAEEEEKVYQTKYVNIYKKKKNKHNKSQQKIHAFYNFIILLLKQKLSKEKYDTKRQLRSFKL